MAFVNYYQVLEIAPTADNETIKVAIRKQRREWRTRTAHPNADTRALAERMTQYVSDAERVLLDAAKRSDFDRQLAAHVETRPDDIAEPGGRDWVSLIRDHLASGNFSAANYAARRATSEQPNFAEAWYLQGISSGMLDRFSDAEFEFGEAIRLAPTNAAYHAELGDLYAGMENDKRALVSYQRANELEPENDYYRVKIAAVYIAQERDDLALPILERAVRLHPEEDLYRELLALALMEDCIAKMSRYGDGTSAILNSAQLDLAKNMLSRVHQLEVNNPESKQDIIVMSGQLLDAERIQWRHPESRAKWAFGFAASITAVFFIGVSPLAGIIGLVGLIALSFFYVKLYRAPGYVLDARQASQFVRKTGIQPVTEQV